MPARPVGCRLPNENLVLDAPMTGRMRKTVGRAYGIAPVEPGGGRVSCFGLPGSSGASHSVST